LSKTVVSEATATVNGMMTTTITYSDGTTEVETSPASAQAGQGNQPGQTYNSQGALGAGADSASAASSGV
jgi:hypothetical protein